MILAVVLIAAGLPSAANATLADDPAAIIKAFIFNQPDNFVQNSSRISIMPFTHPVITAALTLFQANMFIATSFSTTQHR